MEDNLRSNSDPKNGSSFQSRSKNGGILNSNFQVPKAISHERSLDALRIGDADIENPYCNIKYEDMREDANSNSENSTSEDDYLSVSSDDGRNEFTYSDPSDDTCDVTNNTQSSDADDFVVMDAKLDQSKLSVPKFNSFSRPELERPRSLSRISEKSHSLFNDEIKDDMHVPASCTGVDVSTDFSMNGSDTTLTGIDYRNPDQQHDIFYDAHSSNGHFQQDYSDSNSGHLYRSENIIVSGNVGNNNDNFSNCPANMMSPINKHVSLIPTEVASESTRTPSDAAVFKFPNPKLKSQKSKFDITLPPVNPEQSTSMQSLMATQPVNSEQSTSMQTLMTTQPVNSGMSISMQSLMATQPVNSGQSTSMQALMATQNSEGIERAKSSTILTEATVHERQPDMSNLLLSLVAIQPVNSGQSTSMQSLMATQPVNSGQSKSMQALVTTQPVNSEQSTSMQTLMATQPVNSGQSTSIQALVATQPVSCEQSNSVQTLVATQPVNSRQSTSMQSLMATQLVNSEQSISMQTLMVTQPVNSGQSTSMQALVATQPVSCEQSKSLQTLMAIQPVNSRQSTSMQSLMATQPVNSEQSTSMQSLMATQPFNSEQSTSMQTLMATQPVNSGQSTSMQSLAATQNSEGIERAKSSTILTEATVHERQPEMSDLPLSLKNLVFLTKPQSTLIAAAGNSSLTALSPSFMLTSEGKRSNLKKKSFTSIATSANLTINNNTTNNSESSNSLNISGNKKSIKWGSDIPDTKKAYNEPQAPITQEVPKPYGQPTLKDGLLSRENSKKSSSGQIAGAKDKKDYENITLGDQDWKGSKFIRKDTIGLGDVEWCKDASSSRPSSAYSTLLPTSGQGELGGNVLVRALRGLKGNAQGGTDGKNASNIDEADGGVSMTVMSTSGGLSTPDDVTPKDYLADVEDMGTSFDEFELHEKRVSSTCEGTSAADTQNLTLHEFLTSENVPSAPSDVTRNNRARSGFLTETIKNTLVVILSGLYGMTIVVLGLVLPLSEIFANPKHPFFFEIFYMYLYAVSLAFLLYVYTYLLRKEQTFLQTIPKTITQTLSRTFSRSSMRSRSSVLSDKNGPSAKKPLVRQNSNVSSISRRKKIAYNAEASHHTGSFFLRVGVIGFGIGSMIHSGLTFGHYLEVSHFNNYCSNTMQAIKPLAHLCFTFLQMYFIFMHSKICVHKYKTIARFGLIHMSCTNICVWLRSVVVETLQVIKVDQRDTYHALVHAYEEHVKNAEEDSNESNQIQTLDEYLHDHQMGSMPEINCRWDAMMGKIVESSSVYLYPCTIEYSLVCACVLYVMWSNVGEGYTPRRNDSSSDIDTLDSDADSEDENMNHRMSVDCAASSRGLFLGILLFVMAVVCVVCFFVLTGDKNHVVIGTTLGHISEEVILVVAFIATAIAAFQMRQMRFSGKRKIGIEEILTLVSISGLGLYGIWSIIAAVFHLDTVHGRLTLITNLFMLIQAGSQATFTLAALRASARNHEQLRGKPGRQCVTFLLICNFALWVVNTFETQRIEYNQTQINFYGTTAWAIFSHISVPLEIYFRFHSTVNLSIVWKKAWKKTDAHDKAIPHGHNST